MALTIKQAAELDFSPSSLAVTATVRTCTRSPGTHGRILVGLPLRSTTIRFSRPVLEKYRKLLRPGCHGDRQRGFRPMTSFTGSPMRSGAPARPKARRAGSMESTKDLKLTHFTLTLAPKTHNPLNNRRQFSSSARESRSTWRMAAPGIVLSDVLFGVSRDMVAGDTGTVFHHPLAAYSAKTVVMCSRCGYHGTDSAVPPKKTRRLRSRFPTKHRLLKGPWRL